MLDIEDIGGQIMQISLPCYIVLIEILLDARPGVSLDLYLCLFVLCILIQLCSILKISGVTRCYIRCMYIYLVILDIEDIWGSLAAASHRDSDFAL